MNIKGKLILKLTPEVGEGKNGQWTKQVVIIETAETYPKKVAIEFWKDEVIKIQAVPIGQELSIDINIESREYQGKWYNQVKAWRFTANGQAVNVETPKDNGTITPPEKDHNLPIDNSDENTPPF